MQSSGHASAQRLQRCTACHAFPDPCSGAELHEIEARRLAVPLDIAQYRFLCRRLSLDR